MSATKFKPTIDDLQEEVRYLRDQLAQLVTVEPDWSLPGPRVRLTISQRRIARVLHAHVGKIVSRELLYDIIYAETPDEDQPTIDIIKVQVCNIRHALRKAGSPFKVLTVWGVGYRLVDGGSNQGQGGIAL